MEPLSDYELEKLLSTWVAPNAPQGLAAKFSQRRRRWWERLFHLQLLGKRGRRNKRFRKAKTYDTFTG